MKKPFWNQWQANFLAGLAVVMPAVASIAIILFLFGTIANFTDKLLFFLPRELTHADGGRGDMLWYWSLVALLMAFVLVTAIGRMARVYLGRQIIKRADQLFMTVPLLNKIYGALKQVNEALTSSRNSSFQQVVLVEFPREGMYSMGFITGEQFDEVQQKTTEDVASVFVPTTPNPTTGFLLMVPKNKITRLDMSVADGIKFIISIGSVAPPYSPVSPPAAVPQPPPSTPA
jgi:uncharacterized membrane protein